MANDTFSPFIIRSKLHRPQIHGTHLERQHLVDRLELRRGRPLTLISAPAGYGKTTLASSWLEAGGSPCAWISLDKGDNDLRLLLSYYLAAVQTIFPDFGRQTLALVNAARLPPVPTLAASLINEIERIDQSFLLALDDFHLIQDESVLDLFNQLLHHPLQNMHLVLICRRDPKLPIARLRARSLLTEIRIQDLRFNKMETAMFLTRELRTEVDSTTVDALVEKTEGWVTGLRLAVLSMHQWGNLDPRLLEPQMDAQYVMEYLFTEVYSRQPPHIMRYMMATAILNRFCGPLCESVCKPVDGPPDRKLDGWEFLAWLKEQNLFLTALDNEKRWFRFHHLFQKLLLGQLQRHLSRDEINNLHTRASSWFAENGLIEEAIQHALKGENSKAAAQLVAQHGFDLVSVEQWPVLERWLSLVPNDIVYQDIELLTLLAWTHLVSARNAEMFSCLDRIKALFSDQAYPPTVTNRLQGHLEVMHALQKFYSADGERALIHTRQAIEKIPANHQYPRMLGLIIRASSYQMIGNSEKAYATLEEMMRNETRRGETSEGYHLVSPCFVHWVEADLTAMLLTAARSLKTELVLQNTWTLGHGCYFAGIAYYLRNELHPAEEKLLPLVESPYLHHVLNFAHGAFALALIYQARGQADEANAVSESVVSYALDTDNTAVLNLARAFRAEMALRQGRLAEASRWAEQYDARQLTAMYRFYVPQLTLVRVLLTRGSIDSFERAADLLERIEDFVKFTHNKRFQIDVLALQSLLCDAQGEGSAALERLTRALKLAEPDGFIRPFVDEGPRMAELLKQLQRENGAIDYIEKILDAFEQEIVPKSAEHPNAACPQPMKQPLTNRELDVLELLAQRLSNKEIAANLFISPTTVKGHLQNIYQKLDVGKRREAVEIARTQGILVFRKGRYVLKDIRRRSNIQL